MFLAVVLGVIAPGCSSHLIFGETSHVGLKAELSAESGTPAELSIGYRRSLVAWTPQQDAEGTTLQTADGRTVSDSDPGELVSLYTKFHAKVGLGDPVCFDHILATGGAAIELVANKEALQEFAKGAESCEPAEEDEDDSEEADDGGTTASDLGDSPR